MSRRIAALLTTWLLLVPHWPAAAEPAREQVIQDDRGSSLIVRMPAARIVTLAPHLTEIAFAAGAGDRLVGVSSFSDFPELARHLPVVAANGRFDAERILRSRPQAVLAWLSGNSVSELERLERLGLPVIATEVRRLEDIPRLVRLVGHLAGTASAAEGKAVALERSIAELSSASTKSRARDVEHPAAISVFVEIWHQPLMTVNGEHLISDVIRACGARNIFASAPLLTPVVSREQLLKAQPQVLIMSAVPEEDARASERWKGWPIPAVQSRQMYEFDPGVLFRQGPRFIEGARDLCADLRRARRMLERALAQ
jgi:iron complex transport system substrate-binding protein